MLHNTGEALAEFDVAERLGYKLGPREREQQADAYRYRAERELRQMQDTRLSENKQRLANSAARDFDRARNLYEPIAEFSNVSQSLDQLEHSERSLQASLEASKPKPKFAKHKARYAKWR